MTIIGERYRLDQTLGSGGTATVWLAHDVPADRPVAVKLLDRLEREADTEARRERLRREARLLATLDHPNVVRILDVGDHEGHAYIVMEYVTGGSLADIVRQQGPLRPAEAVRLVVGVLGALEAAHQLGVVHRDVKPGNILLRADGSPVLCDFGIARTEEEAQTRTGVALGSMGYMAPEQRIDARKVGPPADVYSAACTLFNLVTADTPVDLYLAHDSSPRWDSVPAPLRPALRHATRPEPSERPISAAVFAAELSGVLPALRDLAPIRARVQESQGYVPTAVDAPKTGQEPSLRATDRERFVSSADWQWAQTRGAPVGRQAVWIAVALVGVVVLLATSLGRLTELAQDTPPEVAPPLPAVPEVAGRWVGAVDGWPAHLTLRGAGEAVTGVLVMTPGSGELRATVHGRATAEGLELVDDAATPTVWNARFGQSPTVVEGRLDRPAGDTVPFAFVRVERME